jgi:predicted DCC family thiol-disulfide oxidoreductase YuxK
MARHWIFWDGNCNFCRHFVAWVRRKDIHHQFNILPYQMAPSPPMTRELYAVCEQAVHVVKADGDVLRGARACLFVLESLGWTGARTLAFPPFVWALDFVYWIVASNRRFFARLLPRN